MRSLREGYGSKLFIAALTVTTLVWALGMAVIPSASAAARHTEGSVVVNAGTVWYIGASNRQGFPTPEVYASYGYTFAQVQAATDGDMALPVGPNRDFADGTLVNDNGTIWIISGGMKRGFTTEAVFKSLGYSFANARKGSAANFTAGAVINNASAAHPAGALVNSNGTIWWITATGRKGVPNLDVFNSYGLKFSQVVPANSADLALTNEGNVAARNNGGSLVTDSQPVGSVSASLASDNPAASTLVAGQAQADLAHFTLSGSGTVSAVTFQRLGVSADSTLANVYLFQGATRLTDAASVTADSKITFAGLNLAVNGSTTVAVKSDIASSTSGQTIGVAMTSFTVSGGSATNVNIAGNIFTIATATLATVSPAAATASGNTNPGNDIVVWQSTVSVGNRSVNLSRLALQQIGSIASSDINNFRLFIDGVQVAQAQSLDVNRYVTFSMSKTLATGSPVFKVLADVIGGSSRTVQMSLRSAVDVSATDTQYGVNILAGGSYPNSPSAFTVSSGSMTIVKTADSPSSNLTLGASDASLGKYTLTAFGEPIKISTLSVQAVMGTNGTSATTIRNGRLLFNGVQYGSTTNMSTSAGTSYTVNYTVNPGSPVTLEVRADVVDGDGTALAANDTIQARLKTGATNGTPQVSLTAINVPTADVDANALTVSTGSLTFAANANYGSRNVVVPQTAYKLAAFDLSNGNTEDINVNTFTLTFTAGGTATFSAADLNNVYIKYGVAQTNPKATVAGSDAYSVSYTLAKNTSIPVEVYGDISSAAITANDTLVVNVAITATTAASGQSANVSATAGQTLTAKTSGTITAAVDSSTPAAKIVSDLQTVNAAAFKFTTVDDSYTITDVQLALTSAAAVKNVILKDGSTVLGTKPAASSVTFSGLSVPVGANAVKVLSVDLELGTVGVGFGATDTNALVTLTVAGTKARSSVGTSAAVAGSAAGNNVYVYAGVPTITKNELGSRLLSTGTGVTIGKFTVASDGGPVGWKKIIFTVTKTGRGTTGPALSNATVWDAASNTQVAGVATHTTTTAADASGSIAFVATNEQLVSGSKTYTLKADIAATLAAGDNVNTNIANAITAHANAAAYATVAATAASFAWSDGSASAHSETTLDWLPDYLVKYLPLDSWTLQF